MKKTGDDYALVVDDDGDWFVAASRPRRSALGLGPNGAAATDRRFRRHRGRASRRWRRRRPAVVETPFRGVEKKKRARSDDPENQHHKSPLFSEAAPELRERAGAVT